MKTRNRRIIQQRAATTSHQPLHYIWITFRPLCGCCCAESANVPACTGLPSVLHKPSLCENSCSMPQPEVAIEATARVLEEKIRTRTARVGIIGLGYVGLPLAVEFAKAGFTVTGIDVQESKIAKLKRGESYVQDVPTESLRPLVETGKF